MSKNTRVLNISRGFRLRFNQAAKAVEQCAAAWVEYGVSIRDVTLAEAIALRNQQASQRVLLAYAELPGLVYEPCLGGAEGYRQERRLAVEANFFAESGVAVIGEMLR
jgi:hypothetical protein